LYQVETFGGAATDDIVAISGVTAGNYELIELWVQVDGHFWTLRHNPSNGIFLQYEQDFATIHVHDFILLRGIGNNQVKEIMRGRFSTL
jgi:hypothetical protein